MAAASLVAVAVAIQTAGTAAVDGNDAGLQAVPAWTRASMAVEGRTRGGMLLASVDGGTKPTLGAVVRHKPWRATHWLPTSRSERRCCRLTNTPNL